MQPTLISYMTTATSIAAAWAKMSGSHECRGKRWHNDIHINFTKAVGILIFTSASGYNNWGRHELHYDWQQLTDLQDNWDCICTTCRILSASQDNKDRHTDRQTDRQTDRHRQRQTERERVRPPGSTCPQSCSVSDVRLLPLFTRTTPWLNPCIDNTPRPDALLPSRHGL